MSGSWRVTVERACSYCRRGAGGTSADVLRAAGWRLYDGPSLTGKELHRIACPWCAGTTDRPDPETSWRVGCSSCEWAYDPARGDDDHEGPLTKAEAQQLAADHYCSPQVWVEPPKRTYATLAPNNLSLLDRAGGAS